MYIILGVVVGMIIGLVIGYFIKSGEAPELGKSENTGAEKNPVFE